MAKKIKIPSKITPILAEETGWHIGDGSMNFYSNRGKKKGIYQLRGHINDDKPHYIKRIKPIFKLLYGINISLRDMPSTGVYGFQIWNDNLVKFKQKLGLPLGKKWNVSIPNVFLKDDNIKIAIIRGIFDTDGCLYFHKRNNDLYPKICFNTISYRLGEQLLYSLRQLGFRTTMYTSPINLKQVRPNPLYNIYIFGHKMLKKFVAEISPKNPKHMAKYVDYTKSF